MRTYAVCLVLVAGGCTTTQQSAGEKEGGDIQLIVECEQGSRIDLGVSRNEDVSQNGKTIEVDPSKAKGE